MNTDNSVNIDGPAFYLKVQRLYEVWTSKYQDLQNLTFIMGARKKEAD
jgi:ethanolamine utilization protein EutP (predicted NTPase)